LGSCGAIAKPFHPLALDEQIGDILALKSYQVINKPSLYLLQNGTVSFTYLNDKKFNLDVRVFHILKLK
jgi:uncharacterized protein (DUF1015 family)